ncbi:MAG: hypothetical protein OEM77_00555 [Nitrosopumilus sp.]|nr:hypothetical protein [Nitrosopumilus sp.]
MIALRSGSFYLVFTYVMGRKMSKLVYKQKIDPDSFDRETALLGIKETLQDYVFLFRFRYYYNRVFSVTPGLNLDKGPRTNQFDF